MPYMVCLLCGLLVPETLRMASMSLITYAISVDNTWVPLRGGLDLPNLWDNVATLNVSIGIPIGY